MTTESPTPDPQRFDYLVTGKISKPNAPTRYYAISVTASTEEEARTIAAGDLLAAGHTYVTVDHAYISRSISPTS